MNTYYKVLSIAGSDSSGGAGIQADIKAISAIGAYAMTAITALTAQNTTEVHSVLAATPESVSDQIITTCNDIRPDAVKTGMLVNSSIVRAVAQCIRELKLPNVVVDPVMVSTSGYSLIDDEAVETLKTELFPLAAIITPNKPEAELLACRKLDCTQTVLDTGYELAARFGCAVLIKGGHFEGDVITDFLFCNGTHHLLHAPKINTANTHGTGCTLSSAIASYLALGNDMVQAVGLAKQYLSQALEAGASISIGHGHGPVNHLHNPQKIIISSK